MSKGEIILAHPGTSLPSLFTARPEARTRMRDFFSSHLRNPNTRRAYREAVRQFSAFCAEHGIVDLALIDAIDTTSLPGLRDRALIGLMVYTFARVGAAVLMKVEDYLVQGRRGWVRLHEKGGKEHEVPCHHNLELYLDEYITAAGIAGNKDGPLFRTAAGKTGELTGNAMWTGCL